MAKVFINYRRDDSAFAAILVDTALSNVLGAADVFRASRSIPPGAHYERGIMQAITQCRVMLVLVGPWWSHSLVQCTQKPDWVQLEIREALQQGIRVMPVLVAGADRLEPDALPDDLSILAKLQYLRLDPRNATQDLALIAEEVQRAISG